MSRIRKSRGRQTDDIIPVVKTFAITLQGQFQRRSTRMTTKSLSATRLKIGASSLPNQSTFTDHEKIHRTKEVKPIPQKINYFFLSTKNPGKKRLLARYGSKLALMDATYRTTMYAIPLFFICAHTYVGYKVVAEFMCQTESQASIGEAQAIIRRWNPTWNPEFFMVNYSTAEIAATEEQFQEVWYTFVTFIGYRLFSGGQDRRTTTRNEQRLHNKKCF